MSAWTRNEFRLIQLSEVFQYVSSEFQLTVFQTVFPHPAEGRGMRRAISLHAA